MFLNLLRVAEPDKHATPIGVEEPVVGMGYKQVTPPGWERCFTF